MNDLDLVREMRADVPETPAARLADGRERLRTAIASSPDASPRRVMPRRRALIAGGLAVAAAAAAVAVATGGSGPDRDVAPRLAAATTVLEQAARTVQTQPGPVLKPHQWLYYRYSEYGHGTGVKTDDSWTRLDAMQDASVVRGKLVVVRHKMAESKEGTPLGAYQLLASLPTNPHDLLATLYRKVGSEPRGGGLSRDELAFENIQQLLWNSVAGAPPRVQAALYRALAQLPGIKVRTGFQYAPGRTAIAVFHGQTAAMLLAPTTYQMIGWVNVSNGIRPPKPTPSDSAEAKAIARHPEKFAWSSPVLPAGTVISSFYRDTVTFVGAPGRR